MVEEFVREQMGISAIAKVRTATNMLKTVQNLRLVDGCRGRAGFVGRKEDM